MATRHEGTASWNEFSRPDKENILRRAAAIIGVPLEIDRSPAQSRREIGDGGGARSLTLPLFREWVQAAEGGITWASTHFAGLTRSRLQQRIGHDTRRGFAGRLPNIT
jgi:hypothetical protein